jgi:hypothetical protein
MEEITRELRELAADYLILFGCFTEEHFQLEEAEGNVSQGLSEFVHRWGWDRALDRYDRYVREEC